MTTNWKEASADWVASSIQENSPISKMNIVVLPHGQSRVICRPDTTWERENKDIFIPDDVVGFHYTPILFARVCKAGKSIGLKFADRYYDSVNYGMLLYPEFSEGRNGNLAQASCMDHTSILPFPLYNKLTLGSVDNAFRIYCGGKEIFSTSSGSCDILNSLTVMASSHTSLRIGDLICMELDEPKLLFDKELLKEDTSLRGTFCDNETFNLRIRL